MQVKLIKDSVANSIRICTFVLEYPRFIHSEVVTHRVFSRNAASSRAIPTSAIIQNIRDNPAQAVWWGKNMSGMQAAEELTGWRLKAAKLIWASARECAILGARIFNHIGLHKQLANRILEPFQNIRVVVTSTEWNNFFNLRDHPEAQPEFAQLARMMKLAMEASTPTILQPGEWHIPYVTTVRMPNGRVTYLQPELAQTECVEITLEQALKISASMAAQESYRKSDPSLAKAEAIWERLVLSKPMHCFSEDTEVLTSSGFKTWPQITDFDLLADVCEKTGKFMGWAKPLNLIKGHHTGKMYSVNSKDISFKVTDGHKMIGHLVTNQFTRYSDFEPNTFIIGGATSNRHTKNTWGEVECRMLTAPYAPTTLTPLGKLIGMYIGDGFKIDNTIAFHFKKERKIEYLTRVLDGLNLQYSCRSSSAGTTQIRVYKSDITEQILNQCNSGSFYKRIGKWDLQHICGIFDGLKNSDGSVKRSTWSYSTNSPQLHEDILNFAPIAGLTIRSNKKQKDSYRLMVQTVNTGKINDSRNESSHVQITYVKDLPVYCATMPSGGLITRLNGKTLIVGNSSPTEHQARAMQEYPDMYHLHPERWESGVTHMTKAGELYSGNLRGFIQHRQLLPNHDVKG